MSKRTLVTVLVGINLLLLGGLILSAYRLPAAHAAEAAELVEGPRYLMVTGRTQAQVDVLYILDPKLRRLHCFSLTQSRPYRLVLRDQRDLQLDFGRRVPK